MLNIPVAHIQSHVPIAILHPCGELDHSTYLDLIARARGIYDAGARQIILDMSGISRMHNSGLVALHHIAVLLRGETPPDPEAGWAAFRAIADDLGAGIQQRLKLLNPCPQVAQQLERAGCTAFLEIHTDLETAIASFEPGSAAGRPHHTIATLAVGATP